MEVGDLDVLAVAGLAGHEDGLAARVAISALSLAGPLAPDRACTRLLHVPARETCAAGPQPIFEFVYAQRCVAQVCT